jgi:enoyl-CoA hydratase/carnithine racemase
MEQAQPGWAAFTGSALAFEWAAPSIARVRFTRPDQMNTLSFAFITELDRAIDCATSGRARVLILTGEGRAFCAGAEITYFIGPDSPLGSPLAIRDQYVLPITRLFDRLEDSPFVTIAAINGHALGGGMEMALACDLRLIATSARLGLPEVTRGALPAAGGAQKLHRLVGRGKALELILLGRQITAAEADRLGLACAVVPPDELQLAALTLGKEACKGSRIAVAQAKAVIYRSGDVDARSARDFGLQALAVLAATPDWAEGMAAFVGKREPRFE